MLFSAAALCLFFVPPTKRAPKERSHGGGFYCTIFQRQQLEPANRHCTDNSPRNPAGKRILRGGGEGRRSLWCGCCSEPGHSETHHAPSRAGVGHAAQAHAACGHEQ
ncbi:FCP, partial [Symbiodinium sp. CCMP2456]